MYTILRGETMLLTPGDRKPGTDGGGGSKGHAYAIS